MYYLITERDLESLIEGEISIKDLTAPENRALLTWCGEDIEALLTEKNKTNTGINGLIDHIKNNLDHCDCRNCIEMALDEALEHKEVK